MSFCAVARLPDWFSGRGHSAAGNVKPLSVPLDTAAASTECTESSRFATSLSFRPAMMSQSGSRFWLRFFFTASSAV